MTKSAGPSQTLIVLQGDYDLARCEELRAQLASGTAMKLVLLDMRDVTFIDATALGEIVGLRRRMANHGVVRVVGAAGHIGKILHLTGVSRVLELHDSFASACEGFRALVVSR